MTDNFEEWYASRELLTGGICRQAWDYQQQKIDKLESELCDRVLIETIAHGADFKSLQEKLNKLMENK